MVMQLPQKNLNLHHLKVVHISLIDAA